MLRSVRRRARATALVAVAAAAVGAAGWGSFAEGAVLPDSRAYEMVSPPDKNGGDVIADAQRSPAAADGNAVGFTSLAGFAGNLGTGISSDYVSVRSTSPAPGTNGWSTRGVMPRMRALSGPALFAQMEPRYVGAFSPDLSNGLLFVWGALDGNANVDGVGNLYRNGALRSPTGGLYDLVSACPLCDATATPLPPYPDSAQAIDLRPTFASASPDLEHVAFESLEQLTADTPLQPGSCDMSLPGTRCHAHVYEWDAGTLRLAGRVPSLPDTECDDVAGPACVPADVSIAGQGTGISRNALNNRTPHAISDGRDGHIRLFFTQPTDASGQTSDQLGDPSSVNKAVSGRVFMRIDGTSTVQLDVPEGTSSSYAPAQLLDASSDGTRAFFMTSQALTADAPADGTKLYMYDTTRPAGDELTLVSHDSEPADGNNNVFGTLGVSDDGRYVYFAADGQLVSGEPVGPSIYLWHDGTLTYIGPSPTGAPLGEDISANANWVITPDQARVTPDGRHMLFSTNDGTGLTGYDQGSCTSGLGVGCRELYTYSADTGALACASCNPSGAPATAMASDAVWANSGAAPTTFHLNRALSDDGSRVFFTTGEALVPQDVNGRLDAYEWTADGTHGCDNPQGCVALLSSGTSTADSYFLDASTTGDDAFFVTREQLVGWDRDDAYDLYDARVGGGFPEPVAPVDCSGDTCQGSPSGVPSVGTPATALFEGAGNLSGQLKPRARAKPKAKPCKRGFVRKRVRGKVKCVKKRDSPHKKSHATRKGHAAKRGAK